MRLATAATFFFLVCASALRAQEPSNSGGVRVGTGIAGISQADEGARADATGGTIVFSGFGFLALDIPGPAAIVLEAGLFQRGFGFERGIAVDDTRYTERGQDTRSYIALGSLIRLGARHGRGAYLLAGPAVGLRLGEGDEAIREHGTWDDAAVELTLGAGYRGLPGGMLVELRYGHGLKDLSTGNNWIGGEGSEVRLRDRVLELSIGVELF